MLSLRGSLRTDRANQTGRQERSRAIRRWVRPSRSTWSSRKFQAPIRARASGGGHCGPSIQARCACSKASWRFARRAPSPAHLGVGVDANGRHCAFRPIADADLPGLAGTRERRVLKRAGSAVPRVVTRASALRGSQSRGDGSLDAPDVRAALKRLLDRICPARGPDL
jgi:hypothetical protein